MPSGITVSTDGQMLFISDPAVVLNGQDGGAIFTLPAQGGDPTPLTGTGGYSPHGLVLQRIDNADQLYFTGVDPADGLPGLFRIPASGGSVTAVAKDAPFNDPQGVAVTRTGTAYVVDSSAGDNRTAVVIEVKKTNRPRSSSRTSTWASHRDRPLRG